MPKVGVMPVLLVGAAIMVAAGSYSALAGPGEGQSAQTSAQNEDAGGPDVQVEGEEDGATGNGEEKIAQAIADEFEVTPEEVLARHDEGIGFGALFKLYQLARAQGMTVDELLATIPTGDDGEPAFGFGNLRKDLTEEEQAVLEEGPKNLGELVSDASKNNGPDDGEGAASAASQGQGVGRGHGKSKN